MSEELSGVRALSGPPDLAEIEAQRVVAALRALPDTLAQPGLAVLLVNPEVWALLVKRERREWLAALAHKVRLDLPGLPVPRVDRGSPALPAPPASFSRSPTSRRGRAATGSSEPPSAWVHDDA